MRVASPELRLSAQRALVGQNSPRLHGAGVDAREKRIVLTFYVAPDLSDGERDDLAATSAMVVADFPDDHTIHEEFVIVRDPSEPLRARGTWVLLQRGFPTVEG